MIDIKILRNEPEKVIKALKDRNSSIDLTEHMFDDKRRRELIFETDEMKSRQNSVSKDIPRFKKEGQDVSELFTEMKSLSENIKKNDEEINLLNEKINNFLLNIPNIPHQSVPVGKDSEDNVEVRHFGTPTEKSFEVLPHWELGKALKILDPERAAKVTGARFHFYKGLGAKLERAVINLYLDMHSEKGYEEIFPPFIVNRESMTVTGQLPKFEDDAFKLTDSEYFLIPTAEVPVTNLLRNEILSADLLPVKYCAYSACFRAEAGSAGRDTRGLVRQHQFNKVELVKFTEPEDSYDELEKLTNDAEAVLQALELPYRVMLLCTGDMGFSSAKTYDIEVWMPSYGKYMEISSCSNFEDFQARRGGIKYKQGVKDKAAFVHTLNGSGVAIGRTVAAILENYQNEDGSITVPKVLVPYMRADIIK